MYRRTFIGSCVLGTVAATVAKSQTLNLRAVEKGQFPL